MPFTGAIYTSLSVWGGPGPASYPPVEILSATDTVTVSLTDSSVLVPLVLSVNRTQLWPGGGPGFQYDIADKTAGAILAVTASDTVSVQWTEDPVDQNFILSQDNALVSVGEVSAVFNFLAVADTASVSLSETIGILQAGVNTLTGSDTLSVTLTDTSSLSVTLSTTDTVSVTLSAQTAAVATSVQTVTATDTVSVTVSDVALLGVFTGILSIAVNDSVRVALTENSSLLIRVPTKPMRIRIMAETTRIRIIPI